MDEFYAEGNPLVVIVVMTAVVVPVGRDVPSVRERGGLSESLPSPVLPNVPAVETFRSVENGSRTAAEAGHGRLLGSDPAPHGRHGR